MNKNARLRRTGAMVFGRIRTRRAWREWLRTQLEQISDVPPELACCEYECRVTHCDSQRFNACERRIAYTASVGGTPAIYRLHNPRLHL